MAAAGPAVPVLRDRRDRGPAIRRARRVGVVRPGAECRRGRADLLRNVPPERAAHLMDMLLGVPASAGWVDKAGAPLSRQLEQAGFDAAMCAALAAEPVLAADETPVNVLAPGAPAQAAGQE